MTYYGEEVTILDYSEDNAKHLGVQTALGTMPRRMLTAMP